MYNEIRTQVVVIGSGPGGYTAAFRSADLGLDTVLVEQYSSLGGVCLNVGCIPSKGLLHIAKIIQEIKTLKTQGITRNEIKIDISKIRDWKNNIVNQLTKSLRLLSLSRGVKIVNGFGNFKDKNTLEIKSNNNYIIKFENAIIASGSKSIRLPFFPYEDHRIWDSTDALTLKFIPNRLLIIGGGIIGLEMATFYYALGSKIDIVEMYDHIIPLADKDVVQAFSKTINFHLILKSKVTKVIAKKEGIYVSIKRETQEIETKCYDAVLISVGRVPNTKFLEGNKIGIDLNEKKFICVDKQMKTNIKNIYAIGDVTGNPMLAHKAMYEGHIAAEVISGKQHYFDPKVIPSVAYTDPEIAWVGLTEKEAIKKNINYSTTTFPWKASGRAIITNNQNGITKLIFEKRTNRIIGGAIVGSNGSELLGEISLAIEMGCESQDIALTIHAHPTLYESICRSSEMYEGTIIDLLNPKLKKF